MSELLRYLPADTGVALVLIQHLDPTHESALTALLARATKMPVLEARNNLHIAPNHLYVIPPNKVMGISRRRLKLSPRQSARQIYNPIDEFMCSLAKEEGNRAIGVVLSGSGGSDGTQGLLAIKTEGGITFAQDEKTAKYSTMPGNAIASGCVDFVLSPENIARELSRFAGHPYIVPGDEAGGKPLPAEDRSFEDILALLRQRLGVDFTHYKRATLARRIQRRMVLQKCESLKEYDNYLRRHPDEAKDLFSDILIHVTGFFRDPAVFQTLRKKVFPRIVKSRSAEEPVRIWVPGCSTGQEVYSIAMSLREIMADRKSHLNVQIFGTDINDAALEKARAGIYPDLIRTDVSVERLRRFFSKTETGWRINKGIREMCIFARQNVATDPPFSNLDMVSCRNVLIYLGPTLQRKVLPLFHYALKPNGFLLLGVSETIGVFADLFSLSDKKAKIYTKKAVQLRPAVTFAQPTAMDPSIGVLAGPGAARQDLAPLLADIQKQADRILLTHHTPAGVVVNRQLDVLQFRGRTGPYLEHAHGEATLNLLKMAREGLTIGLRSVVTRSIRQNIRAREDGVRIKQNGSFRDVSIEVVPFQVPPDRERFYLVLFEDSPVTPAASAPRAKAREKGRRKAEDAELAHVREELGATRESLQAIIEEQEATNEELRSANEEIMSSNEELQSTNEELETAKEELQSTNEELSTFNDELESRNSELEQVNNDLHNLLASVNIPVVMVGGDLRIRRFTGVAEKLLNLIPADVGRPLTDINLRVEVPNLARLVGEVVDTLQTREIDVCDKDGHWWSVRIRPYKTTDNKIDGAVIALVDIDLLKSNMELVRQGRALADQVVNAVSTPVLVMDQDLVIQQANEAFYRTFRIAADETLHHGLFQLDEGAWDMPGLRVQLEDILPHNSRVQDFDASCEFPEIGLKKLRFNARRLDGVGGKVKLVMLAIDDITEDRG